MTIINLGGVGGCRITDCLIQTKIRQVAYPFDWNNTNQFFPINVIKSEGEIFFSFKDQYIITPKHLISPCNNAFLCHDFDGDWIIKKEIVNQKYQRRLQRLLTKFNSNDTIYFVREVIEEKGFRDHDDVFDYIPTFNVVHDKISEWEKFMDYCSVVRKCETKLILFTVNPRLKSKREDIKIVLWDRTDNSETIFKENLIKIYNE
tara:strand:- start:1718 stop:2329 length:612 start_codon:yes stop_codon:yes gene_type:complete